jgi:hypothetical protein
LHWQLESRAAVDNLFRSLVPRAFHQKLVTRDAYPRCSLGRDALALSAYHAHRLSDSANRSPVDSGLLGVRDRSNPE